MIIQKKIVLAREAWIQASEILKFKIITPFLTEINGVEKDFFAFLPEYGSPNGMIVGLLHYFEDDVTNLAMQLDCYYSFINIECFLVYDENTYDNVFIDSLEDWGKFDT